MATLPNPAKNLRFRLTLADQETLAPAPSSEALQERKLVAQAAVEHFDRSDLTWWPFVRLVVYRLAAREAEELAEAARRLIRGESAGFSFRSKVSAELGLQVGRIEGQEDRFVVEVGVDLQGLLGRLSGARSSEGEDLALFRFAISRADLVSFASELQTELRELSTRGGPAPKAGSGAP